MKTLHLCNTHGQLLLALCDVSQTHDFVTIIYLDDEIPLSEAIRQRLKHNFPHMTLHICQDQVMANTFANLPTFLPHVVRRNLRLGPVKPRMARHWQPAFLAGQQFSHTYIYNTGFFMAKSVAGVSDAITLRESGLNNYIERPVSGLKAVFRLLCGYNPKRQTLGEERWIDHIAVTQPQNLPLGVRAKGVVHDFPSSLAPLTPAQKNTLLECLGPDLVFPSAKNPTALLLTQPLDLAGMCDTATKLAIYADMVKRLTAAGFDVFLKNHPRERPFPLEHTTALDPIIPIELWALADTPPFDLGVALCSSSLSHDTQALCAKAIQLVSPDRFYAVDFNDWHSDIPARLDAALAS